MDMDPKFSPKPRRAVLSGLAAVPLVLAGTAYRPARPAAAAAPSLGVFGIELEGARQQARGLEQLNSLIVAQHGEIVLADAFRGPPLNRPVNVKSVSKTVVATLVGVALDRGMLAGVETTVGQLIPGLIPRGADPGVRAITVEHLLTMQAGLDRTSGANYGRWVESRNWVAHALGRPFVAEPGGPMLYSTGSYHVLGAALSRAAGSSLLELARQWLGAPLDITIPPWTRDPQGYYMGGNNMTLSPIALLRFGEMWRGGGVLDGRRVVRAAWVEASWTPRTRSIYSGDEYGYGWFLSRIGGHDVSYARGYGGQMLYVVPSLGLTVVMTSDPTRPARSQGHVGDLKALLADHIIAAAERTETATGRPG